MQGCVVENTVEKVSCACGKHLESLRIHHACDLDHAAEWFANKDSMKCAVVWLQGDGMHCQDGLSEVLTSLRRLTRLI